MAARHAMRCFRHWPGFRACRLALFDAGMRSISLALIVTILSPSNSA